MSSPFSLGLRKIAGNGSGRRLTLVGQERQRTSAPYKKEISNKFNGLALVFRR
jgi:hypothetical protein